MENLHRLVPVMLEQYQKHMRCLFLGSPTIVDRMQYELTMIGVDVHLEMRKGNIVFSSDRSYLNEGFSPERMLALLTESVFQAQKDGFKGLWATGDMTWELADEKNFLKILEYETGLEKVFERTPGLSGICQYHIDTLPREALHDGLLTHSTVYINQTLNRMNPHYRPEAHRQVAKEAPPEPQLLDRMIQELSRV